VLLGYKSEGVT